MSLVTRFLLVMTLLVSVIVGGLVVLTTCSLIPRQEKMLQDYAETSAYYIRNVSTHLSIQELQGLLQSLAKDSPSLCYILVLDKNAKALAHSDPNRTGMVFNDKGTIRAIRNSVFVKQAYTRDAGIPSSPHYGEKVIDMVLPLQKPAKNGIVAVSVGLSRKSLDQIRYIYIETLYIVLVFLVAIIGAGTVYILHKVVLPVKNITKAASLVKDGKFTPLNCINRRDEIGLLAREFTDMSSKISDLLTDLKQREEILVENETKYHTLFESAQDVILILDEDIIIDCNTAALRFAVDARKDEIIGKSVYTLLPEYQSDETSSVETAHNRLARARDGETQYFEWQYVEVDGTRKDAEIFLSPLVLRDKTYFLIFGRDVSDRKKAEYDLVSLNDYLEERVKDRTEQLEQTNQDLLELLRIQKKTQTHLVETEKMAALGRLVAGIAHEINTPIGIGVTAASYLEHKTQELIESIEQEDLTKNKILSFSRIASESSRMILSNLKRAGDLVESFKLVAVDQASGNRRIINLNKYLQEILTSLRPHYKNSPHKINLHCPEDLEIDSYPGAISHIITNLVMNALTHGFEGLDSGVIDITVNAGKDVVMTIKDNGVGMAADVRQRVFEPFFTTKRGQGGSGLGMHIVYSQVVQNLGGTIECESVQGVGTTYTIHIPKELKS